MRMKGKRLIGAISFLTAIFAAFTLNSKAVADLVIDRDDNMTNYVVKEKDGPLEISLSDNAGKPLIGAEIVIQDQSSVTDNKGTAHFDFLEAGEYWIKVKPRKFGGTLERYVTVKAEDMTIFEEVKSVVKDFFHSDEDDIQKITMYSNDWGAYDPTWDMYWYTDGSPGQGERGGSLTIIRAQAVDIHYVDSYDLPTGWKLSNSRYEVSCAIPKDAPDGLYTFQVDLDTSDGSRTVDVGVVIGDFAITMYVEFLDDGASIPEPIIGAEISGNLDEYSSGYASGYTDESGYAVFHGLDPFDLSSRHIVGSHPDYYSQEIDYEPSSDLHQFVTLTTYPLRARGDITLKVESVFHPLEKCQVTLVEAEREKDKEKVTDKNGTVQWRNMAQGTYTVSISKAGFVTGKQELVLSEDNLFPNVSVTLTPKIKRSITMTVKDPVSGKADPTGYVLVDGNRFQADADGVVTIDNIPADKYQAFIGAKSRIGVKKQFDLTEEDFQGSVTVKEEGSLKTVAAHSELKGVLSVGANNRYMQIAIDKTLGYGSNRYGQMGTGDLNASNPWTENVDLTAKVSAGENHSLVLKQDGTVWASGQNTHGELGNGTTVDSKTYEKVSGLTEITEIAAGKGFSLALKSNGTVWAWGDSGQLGNNSTIISKTPIQIGGLKNIIQISAFGNSSICVTKYGTVWGWGDNSYGKLADGTNSMSKIPIMSPYFSNAVQADMGKNHVLVLKTNGTVWSMGRNQHYQTAGGSPIYTYEPKKVRSLSNIKYVSCGDQGNLALKETGDLYTWDLVKRSEYPEELLMLQGTVMLVQGYKANTGNISMDTAQTITCEMNNKETVDSRITKPGQHRYYKFIPAYTALYTFTTLGENDTYGYLRDKNGSQIAYDNDGGDGENFLITKQLTAGTTYYLDIKAYSSTALFDFQLSGSYEKKIMEIAVSKKNNPTLYTALKNSGKDLDKKGTGTIGSTELNGLTGSLILSGYGITDVSGLQACTGIDSLYIDHNSITDLEPISLLRQLKFLDISHNSLQNLDSLYGLTNLKTLIATDNQITQIKGLENDIKLERLYLDRNQIRDIAPLIYLNKMTHLSLSENNIASISGIEIMKSLTYLNFNDNSVGDIACLQDMESLKELRMSNNQISDISFLPDCKYSTISIDGNLFDLNEAMEHIRDIDAKVKIYEMGGNEK